MQHVDALAAAFRAVSGGADIVDLGAESTRPGAAAVSADEEQERLLPVLEALVRERPQVVVSIDTYHASTARAAMDAGAEIINDVSGLLWDAEMAVTVAELRCGLVLMHTRGRPQEWRAQPPLAAEDVVPTVMGGLQQQLAVASAAGIGKERIVLDPGFGFGKLGAENFTLLAGLSRFRGLGLPLLAGVSRKGFLAEAVAGVGAADRGNATVAANVAAILGGAHILRVHDLQAAREAAAVGDALLRASDL